MPKGNERASKRRARVLAGLVAASWAGASAAVIADTSAVGAADQAFLDRFQELSTDRWYVSSGWTNGDHQNCHWHDSQVAVAEGILQLSLSAQPNEGLDLSCGEIQSKDRYGYGAYEARMKVPFATGANANFFTFIGPPQDRPHQEIDFEFITRGGPVLQTNYYFDGDGRHEDLVPVPDAPTRFSTYSFIWAPGLLQWYIDGTLIREETGADVPDDPQKIYLSIWSTDMLVDWMGRFDPDDAPLVLEVDWVAHTPLNETCRFDASILCTQGWPERVIPASQGAEQGQN